VSLRRRVILSMLLVVAISGGVSTVVGGYLLWRQLGQETEQRVRQDLSAAREFYEQRLEAMETVLRYTAIGERFSQAVAARDMDYLAVRLRAVRTNAGFDTICVTDGAGRVIYRPHRPGSAGDSLAGHRPVESLRVIQEAERLLDRVLGDRAVLSGTQLVPIGALEEEDPSLAERARVEVLDTPKARPSGRRELDSGMMLCAAAPVRGPDGRLAGVLQACVLLNRNYDLVDQVQDTVFRDERYRGKLLGTATIFQDDVRISTNVQRKDGSRAIGTRVSAEVYDHVLGQGGTWVGPAWVVNDWYISAYEPICDMEGKRIGMLYVGVLQRKFGDLAVRTFAVFALVAFAGLLAAGAIAWKLSSGIARPIGSLASASAAIARGDFTQELPVESADEIGSLTQSFNTMARSLRERDELLKEQTRLQLTRSERLASIGRLAAGVAHEINNPLTGVLTFAHLLLRDAPEGSKAREDVETIIDATTRCKEIVRGLLDFSRQSEPQKSMADLNSVLGEALNLTQNEARINRVNVIEDVAPDLPPVVIDANQIQEVAVNLMLNAIDAMPDGGTLTVRTRAADEKSGQASQAKRILVAEDETDTRHGLAEVLRKEGYAVDEARDGREAAGRLKAQRFDAVVADLKMPGLSGMELFQMARELDRDIVFIIITGHGTVDGAVEAMKCGTFDYLCKPFPPSALLKALERGLRERASRATTAPEAGRWVEFEIADTGAGIPAENLERVFDPFFTTKPAGKGTGLGLAIGYGIITEHGGRISVSSEVDRGTTAVVRLPVVPEEQRDEP